jgi:hypothetical protein
MMVFLNWHFCFIGTHYMFYTTNDGIGWSAPVGAPGVEQPPDTG